MDGFFCWKEVDIYRGCPCQCECTCADMGTIKKINHGRFLKENINDYHGTK